MADQHILLPWPQWLVQGWVCDPSKPWKPESILAKQSLSCSCQDHVVAAWEGPGRRKTAWKQPSDGCIAGSWWCHLLTGSSLPGAGALPALGVHKPIKSPATFNPLERQLQPQGPYLVFPFLQLRFSPVSWSDSPTLTLKFSRICFRPVLLWASSSLPYLGGSFLPCCPLPNPLMGYFLITLFLIYSFYYFLATFWGIPYLCSSTKDQNHAPCSGSPESQSLDHQGNLITLLGVRTYKLWAAWTLNELLLLLIMTE